MPRDFRQRHHCVEFANGASGFEDRRGVRLQVAEQLGENLEFEFLERRFRRQDFALEFLERGRGEALGADQRLLALVVGGHALEIGLRDLDVVAEDIVVADLERRDCGALALGRLQLRDHAARADCQTAQLIDLGTEAGANHIAVARIDRRLVGQRRRDLRDQRGHRRDSRGLLADKRALERAHRCFQRVRSAERIAQTQTIPRRRAHRADSSRQPLEIADSFQRFRQRAAKVGVEEFFERVVSRVDRVEREQRIDDPVAERARADRGQRFVENRQQRAFARAVGRSDQLEMSPRGFVHHHVLGDAVEARRRDMREVVAEGVFDIEQRDSRRVRDRFVEISRIGCEAISKCRRRALGAERFVIERRQGTVQVFQQRAQLAVFRGDYDFARRDSRDFLAQRRGLANLRREKFAGRDVERCQRESNVLPRR